MKKKQLQLAVLTAGALASAATAQANIISGSIWENVTSVAPIINLDGSLANAATLMGGRPADVTFTVNSPINFDSRNAVNGGTIAGFLGTGGGIITGGADATPGGNTIQNTLFYFTGQVTMVNGQSFVVTHDDGLQLRIGSTLVVNVPGPTPPANTTYTWSGPSGTYNFELAYAENSGLPGVLRVDLPLSAVPEPSTYLAGALLALPFGLSAVRRFRGGKQTA